MAKSIKRNYFYNLSYQIFSILAPLLTAPYIARVFGPERIGIYAYVTTVVGLFVMFGTLSINLFASRELAYYKSDISKRSKLFWDIFILNTLNLTITTIIFCIFIFLEEPQYTRYFLFQSIIFLSSIFDITWLFSSQEEFGKVALRNFLGRALSIALIFTLIKTPDDLSKYFLINTITPLVINISMWSQIKKYIIFVKPNLKDAYKLLPRIIMLFLPTIAISIYTQLDKLMLGLMSTNEQLGYYDYSQKLVKMALALISSITPIMMVRMSSEFKNNNLSSVAMYFQKSFKFATFLSFYIFSMIISIVPEFIPWFFGADFVEAIILTQIISPIIIAIAYGTTAGHQFLLSIGQENKLTLTLFIGAAINFTMNLILIPNFQAKGASLASVFAEISITIMLYFFVSKYIPIKKLLKTNWIYLIFSLLVILIVRFIGLRMGISVVTNIVQFFIGSLVYLSLAYFFDSQIRNILLTYIKNRKGNH